ncbi:MAG: YfhO family protein [Lachnospiraceae bacterium]|nr:YfhO family protein [Lachnospiraceae bacterium]
MNQVNEQSNRSGSRLPMILSFVLPMVVMVGIFAGKQIYPFGDNSFLRTDMYHQYAPFFKEFSRLLKTGGSLTYDTRIGLGSNFVALYAYYLSSPFNWLLILVPEGLVIEFMTYLIVVKTGLAGFMMAWYLKKHFRDCSLAVTGISMLYAMSGYMAAYSWNIMWLDCIWIAPVILLGIELLVRKNRPFLYVIALAFGIVANYYIAIMLCIFAVIYFIAELVLLPKQKPNIYAAKIAVFGIFSLLAGGLAAFLLLPAYKCLMTTASADTTFPTSLVSYFSALEMLARHMMNVDVEIGLDHWPNLYSGVICMLLYPLYILNPNISSKRKIVKSTVLGIMLMSFSMNIPNYIWHGMHYPNSLPCRQSFLYTILLLSVCYDGVRRVRELSVKAIAGSFWGAIVFIMICRVVIDVDDFSYHVYLLSALFIALYALILYLVNTGTLKAVTACILALGLIVMEMGINMAVTSVTTTSRSEYIKYTNSYQILIQQAESRFGDGFFRVEKASRKTKNDGAWTGYRSASIFSSTTQAAVSGFYKEFGMEGNTNAYSFTGSTPLMSSLLSVKYLISSSELDDSPYYEYISWHGDTFLYENLYTMPLGFMVPETANDEITANEPYNPAEAQNYLVSQMTGSGEVLSIIEENFENDSFDFTVPEKGHIFVYVDNSNVSDVTAYKDDDTLSFSNVDRGYLLDLGICEKGTDISLLCGGEEDYSVTGTAYMFEESAFRDWYNVLSAQGMTVDEYNSTLWDTSFTGSVEVKEKGTLFTSIPYDEGWTVTVDGEAAETKPFDNTFLCLDLPAGSHVIMFRYRVPGLMEGILLSIASLLILGALFAIVMSHNHKRHAVLPVIRGGTRAGKKIHKRRKRRSEKSFQQAAMPMPEELEDDDMSDEAVTNMVMKEIEEDAK